jgi:hypothetical protein
MFTQTWRKYLPVILILVKRSANGDQTLAMNHTDFQRAAGGRKIKFTFSNLQLNKGKLNTDVKHAQLAKDLAELLQEDETSRRLIQKLHLEFSLSGNFELAIRNTTPPEEEMIEATAADQAAE